MSYIAPIRAALDGLLRGDIGSIRVVEPGTLSRGADEGQETETHQQQAIQGPRYSIRLMSAEKHPASPVSSIGSLRIERIPVVISLTYSTEDPILENERDTITNTIMGHGDVLTQAVTYPRNLSHAPDIDQTPTHIISGLLTDVTFEITSEEWSNRLIRAELRGSANVKVSQVVVAA